MADKLKKYKSKRNFSKTPEPRSGRKKKKHPIFVIQQHDASSMHWDFRLEVDGVLKSWAVPKGPSTDPADKRLAVPTEDHPMAYSDFEGVIPEGNYGAGAVIVWDTGIYENIKKNKEGEPLSMQEALKMGTVEIELHGQKLKGGYALIRFRKDNWLLVKMKDDAADRGKNVVEEEPKSVLSGKTIDDLNQAK